MSYEFEMIAIKHDTGHISRMQIVKSAQASAFDGTGAANNGFTFDTDTNTWVREITQEVVNREIGRTAFTKTVNNAPVGPVSEWKAIDPDDLPEVRTKYAQIPARRVLREKAGV